ncbi:hypothetical protein SAMN05892883_3730 [Jatrophihabitans sp. GAS493]|nr:hypothetical protein SAMN05892883_3730 [Jatrophihabitans sp. GAS493]
MPRSAICYLSVIGLAHPVYQSKVSGEDNL